MRLYLNKQRLIGPRTEPRGPRCRHLARTSGHRRSSAPARREREVHPGRQCPLALGSPVKVLLSWVLDLTLLSHRSSVSLFHEETLGTYSLHFFTIQSLSEIPPCSPTIQWKCSLDVTMTSTSEV